MKKAVVFFAEGFEEIEALTIVDVLRRGNIGCDICSIKDKQVSGAHNIVVQAEKLIEDVNLDEYDALILPGGMPGTINLKKCSQVIEAVKKFNTDGKIIGAICAAPIVLEEAKIIKGKKITSYPGFEEELREGIYCEEVVVEDSNIITSRGPATAVYFALKIIEKLSDKKISEDLKQAMMLEFVENH